MALHSYFGKKSFDVGFSKLLNKMINSYLREVTDIDFDYNFDVKSRYSKDDEYYDWIIEINTDIPLPRSFHYSDEYKMRKKTNVDGFHHSVLSNEIKHMLPNMGIDIKSLGQTVGIKFTNLK